jgi:DNA-binding NtrC family response regulator
MDRLDLPALKNDLLSYSWPGNVRELRNFCKFIMINEKKINNNVIKKHLQHKTNQFRFSKNHNNGKYIQIQNLKESVASFERDYLLHYLSLNNWKISQTAKSIGLERTTLYKKIKTLGINHFNMED